MAKVIQTKTGLFKLTGLGIAQHLFGLGYEPLPVKGGEKAPAIPAWQNWNCNSSSILANFPDNDDMSIGLRGDNVCFLDCDVYDADLSASIKALAKSIWSSAPIRIGQAPKFGLALKPPPDPLPHELTRKITRYSVAVDTDDKGNILLDAAGKPVLTKCELDPRTTRGEQTVFFGRHPSGSFYRYEGDTLFDIPRDTLPEMTATTLETFRTEALKLMAQHGFSYSLKEARIISEGGDPKDPEHMLVKGMPRGVAPIVGYKDKALALMLLRDGINELHDRDSWVALCHALQNVFGKADEEIRQGWIDWSESWVGEVVDGEAARVWDKTSDHLTGEQTMGSVWYYMEMAWNDVKAFNAIVAHNASVESLSALPDDDYDPSTEEREYSEKPEPHGPAPSVDDDTPDILKFTDPGGLVSALTNWGEKTSKTNTRAFAYAGALAAVSALSQRRWIVVCPSGEGADGMRTPLGLAVLTVGESGDGKETARDVVHLAVADAKSVKVEETPASDAAIHSAMVKKQVFVWTCDEFGRYLASAGRDSGGYDFKVITMAMKLHTMFPKKLPAKAYSSKADKPEVNHPLLIQLHTTTSDALLSAMDRSTVVDGVLGRMLSIWPNDRPVKKPLKEVTDEPMPVDVLAAISRLNTHADGMGAPALNGQGANEGDTISFADGHTMWAIRPDTDASKQLQKIADSCEEQRLKGGVGGPLWARSFEQILRLTGVIALGHAAMDDTLTEVKFSLDMLHNARDVVFAAIRKIVPAAREHATDGESGKVIGAIMRKVKKLQHGNPEKWVRTRTIQQNLKGKNRMIDAVSKGLDFLRNKSGDLETRMKTDENGDRVEVVPQQVRIAKGATLGDEEFKA